MEINLNSKIINVFWCLLLLKERYKIKNTPCGVCSVAQLCLTLCDPMVYSPPVSSAYGVSQARILEWFPTPGDLPDPGIKSAFPSSLTLVGGLFNH